jgi:hypothetical protein
MVTNVLNRQTEGFFDDEARRIGFIGEHHSPESITASTPEKEPAIRTDLEFRGHVVTIYEFPISQADDIGLDPEDLKTSRACTEIATNDESIYAAEWETETTGTTDVEYVTYIYWRLPALPELDTAFELRSMQHDLRFGDLEYIDVESETTAVNRFRW